MRVSDVVLIVLVDLRAFFGALIIALVAWKPSNILLLLCAVTRGDDSRAGAVSIAGGRGTGLAESLGWWGADTVLLSGCLKHRDSDGHGSTWTTTLTFHHLGIV